MIFCLDLITLNCRFIWNKKTSFLWVKSKTADKMKCPFKNFRSKWEQMCSFLETIGFHKGQKIIRTLGNFFVNRKWILFHYMLFKVNFLKEMYDKFYRKKMKKSYVDLKIVSKDCCWEKLRPPTPILQ